MIKLVLSDVDGTLIPLGRGHATERTMHAIHNLQKTGVRFGLSTGRDIVELMQLFDGDDAAFTTGVLSNGKKILVDGEVVRLSLIENEGLERMAELVEEYDDTFVTAYPLQTDPSNPIYCIGTTEDALDPWAQRYSFTGIIANAVPSIQIIGATIACAHGQDVMDEIKQRGAELCPQFDFVQPAPHWCDILPKGLNKGTALHMLLDELGLQRDEVIVFGDADNDLAILNAVEHAVAVENATPNVKAAARWHIGACDDDAVAQALDDIACAAIEGSTPTFMR